MHRSRSVIAMVLGLVVAVGTPLGWWVTHRPSGVSQFNVATTAALTPSTPRRPPQPSTQPPTTNPSTHPSTHPSAHPSARPSTNQPTRQSTRQPTRRSSRPPSTGRPAGEPIQVRIDSIEITAPVDAVGVDARGDMELPANVSRVGWYRWSARPGSRRGSTVLAGHVDSAVQGLGAMFRLRDVKPAARITVVTSGGRSWHYRVVALEEFPKTTVPLGRIFARDGSPRLTVVICGGSFDQKTRSYDDNVVVTAVPT